MICRPAPDSLDRLLRSSNHVLDDRLGFRQVRLRVRKRRGPIRLASLAQGKGGGRALSRPRRRCSRAPRHCRATKRSASWQGSRRSPTRKLPINIERRTAKSQFSGNLGVERWGSPVLVPIYGGFVDNAGAIRPDMHWYRRHESEMQATWGIRMRLNVSRETIRNDLTWPGRAADYSGEREYRLGVIMARSTPHAHRSGPFDSLASRTLGP